MLPIERQRAEYEAYRIAADLAGMSRATFRQEVDRHVACFGSGRPEDYLVGARRALAIVRPPVAHLPSQPPPCCPLAERLSCVCLAAYRCPFHHEIHHGTHE